MHLLLHWITTYQHNCSDKVSDCSKFNTQSATLTAADFHTKFRGCRHELMGQTSPTHPGNSKTDLMPIHFPKV